MTGSDFEGWIADRLAIELDSTLLDEALQPRPRQVTKMGREKAIEAVSSLVGPHGGMSDIATCLDGHDR